MSGNNDAEPPRPERAAIPIAPLELAPPPPAPPPVPAAAADGGGGGGGPGGAGHHDELEHLFRAELDEVSLLLDFIAGRKDKNLSSLEIDYPRLLPDPADPTRKIIREKMSAAEIAQKISRLRFVAMTDDAERAEGAAFLVLVKDQLCALASPATAQSIAFTQLFVEKLTAPRHSGDQHAPGQNGAGGARSQAGVARRRFPYLDISASRFRAFQTGMQRVGVCLAICGALLLAEATYGAQLTQRLRAAQRDEAAATERVYTAYAAVLGKAVPDGVSRIPTICPVPPDPATPASAKATLAAIRPAAAAGLADAPAAGTDDAKPADPSTLTSKDLPGNKVFQLIELCDEYAFIHASYRNAIIDVHSYATSLPAKAIAVLNPIHPLDGPPSQETGPSVAGMVSAFANYVLPLLFGMVGSLSGMMRSIQNKIQDSLLMPRDQWLLSLRILLGVVAGAAVGLFFDPSKVAASVTSDNAGLSLTASGLAFLAGYGSSAFFRLIDQLLGRVFDFTDDQKGAPAAAGRTR